MRCGRRFDWALAGATLGMTHYFFEAGRLLFTPLLITWFGWLWITGRSRVRARRHGLAVMALMTLLVAAPVYYVVTAQGSALAGRLDQSRQDPSFVLDVLAGSRSVDELARHVLTPPLLFVSRPESAAYYAGDQPLVLSGFVPLFLLGIGYVLLRPQRPAFLLIIWLAAVVGGNILLKDPGVSARYVVALPAVAVLLALGLRESARLLAFVFPLPPVRRLLRLAVPLTVAAMGVIHMAYYFGPHMERFNVQNRASKIYRDGVDAVLRSAQLPEGTLVLLISQPESDSNVTGHFLSFMRPDMSLSAITPQELTHRFLAELPPTRPYAFFAAPDDAHSFNLLSRYFFLQPPAITPNYASIPGDRQYVLYFAPLGALRDVPRVKNTPIRVFTAGE
jgi:hypothetical protein